MRNAAEPDGGARSRAGCRRRSRALYDDPAFKKAYPFAALIRKQLDTRRCGPSTPAYADVSLAISKTVSPPSAIEPERLREHAARHAQGRTQVAGAC